jgi:hypothetical protein
LAGAKAASGRCELFRQEDTVLSELDHIILGIDDLDRGVAWLEERAGVRAIFGGIHPGRGTCNALLALGSGRYLEILAPDPQQSSLAWFTEVRSMTEPKLLTWAVHTSDLAALARNAVAAGFPIDGPQDGARTGPDGKILNWRLFHLRDNYGGLLPFFIEWGRESVHPSTNAPPGCRLERFHLESSSPQELARACQALSVEASLESGEKPLLRACIASPRGEVELTS